MNDDANGVDGKKLGLAEFSNGNFLGEDATYKEYFSPSDIHYFPFPARSSTALSPAIDTFVEKNGHIGTNYYLAKVRDGIAVTHHSRLTYWGLKHPEITNNRRATTIDDPNVLQDYHSILIPKAVEYSAGLLDYFFRGTISAEITDYDGTNYTVSIQNTSSDDFHGGTFYLYQQDTNNVRTLATNVDLTSTLASGDSTTMMLQGNAPPLTQFICIYRGTISVNGSPDDPVDSNIAMAATTFDNNSLIFDLSYDDSNAEVDLYLTDPCSVTHYEPDLYPNITSSCCKTVGGDDSGDGGGDGVSQHMVVSKMGDGNYQLWANLEFLNDSGPVNCTLITTSTYSGVLTTNTFTLETGASGQTGQSGWPIGVTGPAMVDTNGVPSSVNASWYVRKAVTISNGQPVSY